MGYLFFFSFILVSMSWGVVPNDLGLISILFGALIAGLTMDGGERKVRGDQ